MTVVIIFACILILLLLLALLRVGVGIKYEEGFLYPLKSLFLNLVFIRGREKRKSIVM